MEHQGRSLDVLAVEDAPQVSSGRRVNWTRMTPKHRRITLAINGDYGAEI
jgi:hypothetical protein